MSKLTFDKTGTLTYGVPKVTAVQSVSDYSENEIFAFAASAERFSEHPLGKAIVKSYTGDLSEAKEFKMIPGEGVSAIIDSKLVKAGNLKLLCMDNTSISAAEKYLNDGATVVYVSVDDVFAGFIVLSDTLRDESPQMIEDVSKLGIQPVLLTGDNQKAANSIAGQLNIKEVFANCLPEDKLNYIDVCQKGGSGVCMIGDGINDAPALKKANVGIAMGGVGSDIAVDAADIAIVDDDIKGLPHLLALSKRMMTTIKINLSFLMGLNFLAITLAITGLLGPVVGALVHNAGSVLVIINSAFLLKWRKKNDR